MCLRMHKCPRHLSNIQAAYGTADVRSAACDCLHSKFQCQARWHWKVRCVTPQRSAIACRANNAAAQQVRVEPAPPPRRPPLGPLPVNGLAALLGLAFLAASLLRRPPGPAPPAAVEKQPPSAEQETARVAEQLSADLDAVAQEQALDSPAPPPPADEERPPSAEREADSVAEQLSADLEAVAQEQALDSPAPPAAVEERPPSAEREADRVAEQLSSDLEAMAQEQALDSPDPPPAADEERPPSAERETARVAEQLAADLEAVAQEQALDSPAPPPAACAPATASASSSALCSVTSMVRPSAAMCSPVLDSARQAPCPVLLDLHGAALCCECALLC